MNDHVVNVGLNVDVKGEEKVKALGRDINAVNKQTTSTIKAADAAVSTITPSIKQATAANAAHLAILERNQRTARSMASRGSVSYDVALARLMAQSGGGVAAAVPAAAAGGAASAVKGAVVGNAIASSIKSAMSGIGTEIGAFGQFAAGVARSAAAVALVTTAVGALAAAATVAVAGIAALVGVMKLMSSSVKWAGEAADKTIDTFDRMFKNRTTFGQEVERNASGIDLIGKSFDKLNDKVKDKKFFDSDFAKNWGITQGALGKFGAKQPGAPGRTRAPDTLDILEKSVAKRESLEQRLAQATAGSKSEKDLQRKLRLFSDNVEDFDSEFAKAARVLTSEDIKRVREGNKRIADLMNDPKTAKGALAYKQALSELDATFNVLKFNIGSSVMPTITKAVQSLTQSLQGAAPQISRLGSAVAGKGWEVISAALARFGVAMQGSPIGSILDQISAKVEGISAEGIVDKISGVVEGLGRLGNAIIGIGEAIAATKEYMEWANAQRKLVRPEEVKESIASRFDPFLRPKPDENAPKSPFDKFQPPLPVEITNPDALKPEFPNGVPSPQADPRKNNVVPFPGAVPMPRERPAEAGPSAADLRAELEKGGANAGQSIQGAAQRGAESITQSGTTGGGNFASAIATIGWAGFGTAFGQAAAALISAAASKISVNVSGANGAPSKGPDVPAGVAAPVSQ